ncbi:MAG: hypothetical protein V8S93_04480 [Lachnospiraceae bacterium]
MAPCPAGKDEKVRVRTKIAKAVDAPVREGTPVGQRDYMIDGIILDSDPVVTDGKVDRWDFGYAEKDRDDEILALMTLDCRTVTFWL